MRSLLFVLLGAIVTWAVSYSMPGLWTRLLRRPAVFVHVEADPSAIYAGGPNWFPAQFVVLGAAKPHNIGAPPSGPCRDWRNWIWASGVYDGWRTELLVTVQGAVDSSVL